MQPCRRSNRFSTHTLLTILHVVIISVRLCNRTRLGTLYGLAPAQKAPANKLRISLLLLSSSSVYPYPAIKKPNPHTDVYTPSFKLGLLFLCAQTAAIVTLFFYTVDPSQLIEPRYKNTFSFSV